MSHGSGCDNQFGGYRSHGRSPTGLREGLRGLLVLRHAEGVTPGDVRVQESVVASLDGPDSDLQWIGFLGDDTCPDPWPAALAWADDLLLRQEALLDQSGDPGLYKLFPVPPPAP